MDYISVHVFVSCVSVNLCTFVHVCNVCVCNVHVCVCVCTMHICVCVTYLGCEASISTTPTVEGAPRGGTHCTYPLPASICALLSAHLYVSFGLSSPAHPLAAILDPVRIDLTWEEVGGALTLLCGVFTSSHHTPLPEMHLLFPCGDGTMTVEHVFECGTSLVPHSNTYAPVQSLFSGFLHLAWLVVTVLPHPQGACWCRGGGRYLRLVRPIINELSAPPTFINPQKLSAITLGVQNQMN